MTAKTLAPASFPGLQELSRQSNRQTNIHQPEKNVGIPLISVSLSLCSEPPTFQAQAHPPEANSPHTSSRSHPWIPCNGIPPWIPDQTHILPGLSSLQLPARDVPRVYMAPSLPPVCGEGDFPMAQGLSHFPHWERIREFFLIRKNFCWERSCFPGPGAKSTGTVGRGGWEGDEISQSGSGRLFHPRNASLSSQAPGYPFQPGKPRFPPIPI